MALFSECSLKCARKVLDTADIVREAMLRQQCADCLYHLANLASTSIDAQHVGFGLDWKLLGTHQVPTVRRPD
jgi:hypothetical protein